MAENIHLSRVAIRSSAELGLAVAATRKRKGYSQQAFVDLAGVGRRFISDLENGKTTSQIDKVLVVLTALGIDVELSFR